MATAEEQLSIKVTSEGLKESTKDLRELEAAVTETASAASTGGKTVTTAVSVTAQDVKKATSDIVAAVDRVRTSNATAFQGLSSDVRTAAASIKGSLDQIKVSNEASSQAVVAAIERIGASMTEVAQKYNESAEKMKESTGGLEQKAGGLKDVAGSLAAAWAGAAGTRAFVTGTLEAAASMESLEKAFKAAGGSAQQFEEVKRMAADTPVVDNQTAVNAVAAFSRMGYSIDEAKDKVKTLANAAAYFGKNSSDMERAIVQIEQLAGKTTGFSGDLLAISNALPDVRQRLNEAFGTETVEEIQELGVTGQDVAEMLVASYGELPEVTAGTQESLDSLGASFEEIKAELGKAFIPALQLVASWLTNVADAIKAMPNWLKNLIAWSTAAAGVATAVIAVVRAVKAARTAIQELNVVLAIKNALSGGKGWAMLAGAVAVGAAATAVTVAQNRQMEEEDFRQRRAEAKKAADAAKAAQAGPQLAASAKPQAEVVKAEKDAAKEAAKAREDAEKEKAKEQKDAIKDRIDAAKAEAKEQKEAEKEMAEAARESAREQQKAYAETEAALKKQQKEREALAQKAEETARRVKEAVIGATAKGQINLASTSMWSQTDDTVYSIRGSGTQTAQQQAVGELKEAFRAVQVEMNDRYYAENNTLLKNIYGMLSQVAANLRQQSAVKLPTGR